MFKDEKEDIYPILVNIDSNKEYLEKTLHKDVSDELAVIYELRPENGISLTVTELMQKTWNVTLNDIHEAAMQNCIETATYINVFDSSSFRDGSPGESLVNAINERRKLPSSFIITNEEDRGGASILLAEDIFKKMAEIAECNFAIVPASKDEIIAFKVTDTIIPKGAEKMNELLAELNETHVHPRDVISSQIYIYDKDMGEIVSYKSYCDRFNEIMQTLPHTIS